MSQPTCSKCGKASSPIDYISMRKACGCPLPDTHPGWSKQTRRQPLKAGVYKKVAVSGKGKGTGVGNYYQFVCLSRNHYTGEESVIYIPLRIEPEWAGTVRMCDIPRKDFERMFMYMGEGLPAPMERVDH